MLNMERANDNIPAHSKAGSLFCVRMILRSSHLQGEGAVVDYRTQDLLIAGPVLAH